jgi:hypothetical protein
VADPQLPRGLRTVDGSFNNLVPGQQFFGAADRAFPRLTTPVFKAAEPLTIDPDGPGGQAGGQFDVVHTKEGIRQRLSAACGQQPDRRPDGGQPGGGRGGGEPLRRGRLRVQADRPSRIR